MQNNQCPEFPYFGATYPDARCIDGYLWDLDKYEDGQLYGGGEIPCPFCNQESFLEYHDNDGIPREDLIKRINATRVKYQS